MLSFTASIQSFKFVLLACGHASVAYAEAKQWRAEQELRANSRCLYKADNASSFRIFTGKLWKKYEIIKFIYYFSALYR